MQTAFSLERRAVRRAFDRAASTFDSASVLHREVRERMLGRLELVNVPPRTILDLGTGTGLGAHVLARKFPRARTIAIDSSFPMLQRGRQRLGRWRRWLNSGPQFLRADASRLPLKDASVDWIFSNLMLPWCDSLDDVLSELRRVLSPRGVLAFSSFGPDTLREVRRAWRAVDNEEHVHVFIDMHDLGDALVRAGFAEPVLDVERFTLTYPDVAGLLRDLRAAGSTNALRSRRRSLRSRSTLTKFAEGFETLRNDGVLPVTYEVVYGHAWQGDRVRRQDDSREVRIPAASIRRRRP